MRTVRRTALLCHLFSLLLLLLTQGCEAAVRAGAPPGEPAQEAPTSSLHPEARRAISELRSPYCPGLMLEVCPSPDAEILRDSIDDLARSGIGADSIVSWVIAEHGEEWRAVPRREGWGWWAWLMPPAALALGLVGIAVVLHRRRRAGVRAAPSGPLRKEDEEKLRRAMDDLDASEHPDW